MILKNHSFQSTVLAALLCSAPFIGLHAQIPGDGQPRPPHDPPPSPLFDALDTNHDGVISADEIANAPTALKALLKNGANQITREDVRPPHPPREQRDEPGAGRPHPGAESFRPHQPPPADADRATDAARPPRAPEDVDQAEHAFHRPPLRGSDEDRTTDEHARAQPPIPDGADRPEADAGRPHDFRDGAGEHPRHQHGPPPSPLFDALDTNHDGVISADEIANAPESLKKLDKAGSGQIKREDLQRMPPPVHND